MDSKNCRILGTWFLFIFVLNSMFQMGSASSFREDDESVILRRQLSAAKNIKKLIPSLFRFFTIYNNGLTIVDLLKMTIHEIESLIKGQCHCFTLCSMDVQYFLSLLQLFQGKSPIFLILDILGLAVHEIQSLVEKECNCTGCCFNSTFLECKDCCRVSVSPSPSPSPSPGPSPSPSPVALPPRQHLSLPPSPSPTPLPESFSSPLPKPVYFSWTLMCAICVSVMLYSGIMIGYI